MQIKQQQQQTVKDNILQIIPKKNKTKITCHDTNI